MKKRTGFFLTITCVYIVVIAGCQGKAKNSLAASDAATVRTVTVVTSGGGLPYSLIEDGNKWSGLEAEMWAEIEKRRMIF
jgi:hypothetical protein